MIVTNGTPSNFQNYTILSLSWDECLAHCLKTDNCMVVYTDRPGYFCQFFKIGNLRLVKRSNNTAMRIGFKIRENNRSAICPSDDTIEGEGYSFDDYSHWTQRYYNRYTFLYREKTELWMFSSSGRHGCPTVFHKMFMRPAGPWCVGAWGTQSCVTHSEAVARCAYVKNSVLSGIDSLDEWTFVSAVSSSAWMGGTRKESCIGKTTCKGLNAFDFVDPTLSKIPTGFSWHSQKPNGKGEDCLAITVRNNGNKGIEDISCRSTFPPGSTNCFKEVVCGAYPLLGAF